MTTAYDTQRELDPIASTPGHPRGHAPLLPVVGARIHAGATIADLHRHGLYRLDRARRRARTGGRVR